MAYSYTRQSSMSDGDTITAALFNNEYNQLVNAFAYSSSSAGATGHRHDGTAGHGGSIATIGDLDFLNKIVADSTNNRWGVFVEVSSSAVEQIRIQDGAIVPVTDNDIDLGTSSLEFKDAYFDGTVTSDAFAGPLTGNVTGNASGTAATVTTAAQSNITSLGTLTTLTVDNVIINGTTIGHTSDTDLMTLTSGVLTVAGELDATTLDISGNADIDGTLEADAYTVDGTALNEYIADTVGAMVSSNTETNITVTYEDGDNTLDFVIGTLNQDTSGTAALATSVTVSANNSTDETVYPIFVDGATGTQGAESDTGLTYNPSTGMLTSTGVTSTFTGNITGNVTGNTSGTAATVTTAAQTNITSLGTLTALTVDNLGINGNTITANSGALNLTPASGSAIVLDGTISVDAGVVTGATAITLSGELDAGSLDISGDADIDGTLEADAITIGGVTLSETIADTVGAMVTSNTESGVTVAYQDADNTIDFTVGTLNQDTTGLAATATALATARTIGGTSFDGTANIAVATATEGTNVTVSANNSTDETVYPTFVDGATGTQGIETDTGLTYNPSSGLLTISGELDAGSLDISGNADIDGTLEADAYTVDGTALNEYIADTVGAMVGSNTESGITVAYQDGDNTLDFTVGTLNQDTTGTAATVTTAAQSNITSLGTLTTLTVDNVIINGSTIGHTGDTDLITVASGIATVAGEVSMTTLDIGGTNVTSTAAELNILDGVTSTAAELNILDGVNSTAAELNIMDGGTAASSTTLADADRVVVNDNGTMKQVAMTDFDSDRFSIVTTAPTSGSGKRVGHVWYVV